MSKICRNMIPIANSGLDLRINRTTFMGLLGLEVLNRAAVSGLDWCLLSRGIRCLTSKWSTGTPSRLRNDRIPEKWDQELGN